MNPILKWGGVALGALVAIGLVATGYDYVASEAVIGRTYPPRAATFHAVADARSIARGAHLAIVTGCVDCHGPRLTGKRFSDVPDSEIWSRNLRLLARSFSDADFERAIRQGIRPDRQSVVIMPSNAYATMTDRDLNDIVAYLRSLKPEGSPTPEPRYGLVLRGILVAGKLKTTLDYARGDTPSLDLGPRYTRGRQLAAIACAECHNTNLGGARPDSFFKTPDLSLVAAYERADFVKFMRTGKAAGGRELATMSGVARIRFVHFSDDEISALYDYLVARGQKLADTPS